MVALAELIKTLIQGRATNVLLPAEKKGNRREQEITKAKAIVEPIWRVPKKEQHHTLRKALI